MTTGHARWVAVAACCALGLAVALHVAREVRYPPRTDSEARLMYLRSPSAVKRLTSGLNALAADVYWIRTIQHYGGDRLARDDRRKYELLQPLLEITTTLDPFFTLAYRFGGILLSEAPPDGPGRPDQAITLLERGLAADPTRWQYFYDVGFIHFWHRNDPVEAARWFERASAQPAAPNWIQPLAAAVLASRDRASAKLLWQRLLESDQPWLRRTAARSLAQMQAVEDCEALQVLVTRRARVMTPLTWPALVGAGLLDGIPRDPTGVPYAIDAATGRVTLSPESTLSPLPDLLRPPR